jgi:hypothetical protein
MEFVDSERKVLFVHIPRTAGSSLVKILSEQLNYFRTLDSNRRSINYRYLKDYSEKFRQKHFIFSFVRNPWDRVVSSFLYLNSNVSNLEDQQDKIKYLERYNGNFKKFVKNAFKNEEIFQSIYFRPQNKWICDEDGNALVNFLGRYENLNENLNDLSKILKVDFKEFLIGDEFRQDHYRNYYNKKTKRIISKIYSKDIELFGYEF